eukprot:CAMPEP_0174366132 /NCGR_PEP_ID=MMETSP0811_2-20130205/80000_1 /TAXON_ID=73025 ORGANISM="Eutreptiella gymnastica-like, Strain CCMP1594" /NCGR_SAMPLE_ID=MMETSP0811_2 /ASSEMBLY_ACC=CAM_ASM_000667 /LENGTH=52 /DNA_ID=CAMNT_0015507411 /DNA_START=70 /DNA_END=228 /DNA_ORIENTATION=-
MRHVQVGLGAAMNDLCPVRLLDSLIEPSSTASTGLAKSGEALALWQRHAPLK